MAWQTNDKLQWMLDELHANWLEVIVVDELRKVISFNCDWYRKLCRQNMGVRKRRPRSGTLIRRQHTIKALERMLKGNLRGSYAERILAVLETLEFPEIPDTVSADLSNFEIPP